MTFIKSVIIAFSMYSKIPMPQFTWQEKEMKYALCFFPWVGAAIGALTLGWWYLCKKWEIGVMAFTLIGTAIPLIVTGGFHVDGFMDTMDAFHSYQERERKLEILKDSHIGAFSVICLLLYYLIYIAAYSEVEGDRVYLLATGFFLSRGLSGIGVVSIPGAKKEGLLYMFSSRAHKHIVKAALFMQLFLVAAIMLSLSWKQGGIVLFGAAATYFYYYYRSKKELGGITGDTAGYFLTLCEGVIVVLLAICSVVRI